jgi:hypothetical protein
LERADASLDFTCAFGSPYVATVTLHDAEGAALHTIRCGSRMPRGDVRGLCQSLARDVNAIQAQRPELKVVYLVDGAVELRNLAAAMSRLRARRWWRSA